MKNTKGLFFCLTASLAVVCSCSTDNPASSNQQLATPSNLAANIISSRQLELTWQDNSSDETGFLLERSKGAMEILDDVLETGRDATRVRQVLLDPNTQYFFRVRATRGTERSFFSDFVAVRTPANEGPWLELDSGLALHFQAAALTGSATGLVAGERGTILRTTNSGASWTQPFSRTENTLSDIMFLNANAGLAVGTAFPSFTPVILATSTGGLEWRPKGVALQDNLRAGTLLDESNGVVVGDNATILKSIDTFTTWVPVPIAATNDLFDVDFADGRLGLAVGSEGTILKTTDAGDSWARQPSGTVQTLRGVCLLDSNNAIAVGDNGTILRTTDGGSSWTLQESGTGQDLFSVSFAAPDTGFTAGGNGTILTTTDGGVTWGSQASGTTNDLLDIHFLDTNTGMVAGEYGTVLLTTVGGRSSP